MTITSLPPPPLPSPLTVSVFTTVSELVLSVPLSSAFAAHALNGSHHILLLGEEGVPEIGRPLDILGQALHHVGTPP